MTDFMTLSGDAEVAEITVGETAQIAGKTLKDVKENGLLKREMLVVTIERDGRVISPQGETTIEPGDIVTLLSPDGIDTDVHDIFERASKEEV